LERAVAELAHADAATRQRRLPVLLKSLLRPITTDDDRALSWVGWNIARLYQQSEDDRVLDALRAAGFDTEAAETMHGSFANFLSQDPAFLRRHPLAARFVYEEIGPGAVGAPFRIPTIADAEEHCRPEERRGRRQQGYLRAASDPSARVSVDGRDTGLRSPIGLQDQIFVGPGRHRVTFVVGERRIALDVDVRPAANGCAFTAL
jgi:hypothetical protein